MVGSWCSIFLCLGLSLPATLSLPSTPRCTLCVANKTVWIYLLFLLSCFHFPIAFRRSHSWVLWSDSVDLRHCVARKGRTAEKKNPLAISTVGTTAWLTSSLLSLSRCDDLPYLRSHCHRLEEMAATLFLSRSGIRVMDIYFPGHGTITSQQKIPIKLKASLLSPWMFC